MIDSKNFVSATAAPLALLAAIMLLVGCDGGPQRIAARDMASAHLLSLRLGAGSDHGIVSLPLAGGEPRWLYRAPPGSEVRQFTLDRAESTLVYSFVPPPSEGVGLLDRAALYRVNPGAEVWSPERLLGGEARDEFLIEPALSPDGRFCYFVRVAPSDDQLSAFADVSLRRLDLRDGSVEHIIDNGIWPAVSPDGSRIAFVGVQPLSQQRGLFVADADGSDLNMVVPIGRFFDVDAPVFSPDGRHVLFAVAEEDTREPAQRGMSRRAEAPWWWRLLPFEAAHAHNDHDVRSDWWRVEATGGEAQRVTKVERIISNGAFADRSGRFAYSTTDGIYLMDASADDSDERVLRRDGAWTSIAWWGGRR